MYNLLEPLNNQLEISVFRSTLQVGLGSSSLARIGKVICPDLAWGFWVWVWGFRINNVFTQNLSFRIKKSKSVQISGCSVYDGTYMWATRDSVPGCGRDQTGQLWVPGPDALFKFRSSSRPNGPGSMPRAPDPTRWPSHPRPCEDFESVSGCDADSPFAYSELDCDSLSNFKSVIGWSECRKRGR